MIQPTRRLRRLRNSPALRDLMRETRIHLDDLIYPIFIEEELDRKTPIASMPGVDRHPESGFEKELDAARATGIKSVILFGVSRHKDSVGSDAFAAKGLVHRMVAKAKNHAPDMTIMADICFCEYTDHGHCGVLHEDGHVHNDMTLENLAKQAVVAARAGVDVLAPSGMMDGMVAAIREAVDQAGYSHVPIISYSSKFSSSLYGPFREASGVRLNGDRKTYQADPANARAALLESVLDEAEGADALMVKPGLPYLDVISRLRQQTLLPIGAYQVSGEYAMIKFAAKAGAIDERAAVLETLTAFKRAGADFVLTYFAKDVKGYLEG